MASQRAANAPTKQGEASRAVILDAASRLMSARGYDGTSMSALVKESGLPASSIYYHFESKQGVLAAVMERGAHAFFTDMPSGAELADVMPREMVRLTLLNSSKAIRAHPEFLRLFMLLLLQGREDAVVQRVREEGRGLLHELITAVYTPDHGAKVAKEVADEAADFALCAFDGAFLALQVNPRIDHESLMAQTATAILALGDSIAAAGR